MKQEYIRFKNKEANLNFSRAIKRRYGYIIKISRKGLKDISSHHSFPCVLIFFRWKDFPQIGLNTKQKLKGR